MIIRGATLLHDNALLWVPSYPRQLTHVLRCRILWASKRNAHLTAPSAVHLMTCFSPDSQQRGLSVEA